MVGSVPQSFLDPLVTPRTKELSQGIAPRERQAEIVLPVECLLDSTRMHFSGGLPKLVQSTFTFCSPIGSPTSRGLCTVQRRRFNVLTWSPSRPLGGSSSGGELNSP